METMTFSEVFSPILNFLDKQMIFGGKSTSFGDLWGGGEKPLNIIAQAKYINIVFRILHAFFQKGEYGQILFKNRVFPSSKNYLNKID